MANLSPVALILIVVVCAVVALLIGYFLGSRFGGKKSVAMKEATEKHDSYKNDVREHFEQTSAIMSRMVDDYRDMYQHMAEGAEKLAEMHPEKLVTPPPAPEAITRDTAVEGQKEGQNAEQATDTDAKPATADQPSAASRGDTHAPNRDAVMNSDSSNDRPWNKESKEKGGKRYGLE
ncbi:DUF1043 family protein [Endozoicomonas sp. G2_2]|uniref:ZapG family protein n=1 Tax=Endozoicomonas sp. G2_2 TaxID=2821092 RepID=UPI001ADB21B6|nr:DUF1043 family protein [Endozoicomonas sp. G2_2]MBO9470707.1 DUF1043 family protein [Endozoicomonas sp. G2_2]